MEDKPNIKIVIAEDIPRNSLTNEILRRAQKHNIEITEGDHSKRTENTTLLYLSNQKGFLRPCPCSRRYRCCNYFTIDTIEGCIYDCEYCALKTFIDRTRILIKVDIDEMIQEVRRFEEMITQKDKFIRIGTGELSDSLALEWIAPYAPILIAETRGSKNIFLEFKTKSTEILSLLDLPHNPNTTISFSLSTNYIHRSLEGGTPNIEQRILAAKRLVEKNYRVGFHFDPIIFYESYEKDYESTIESISKNIPEEAIGWISLGTIRFTPSLIDEFESPLLFGEYILDAEKKYRYPFVLRKDIYRRINRIIRDYIGKNVRIYLCMESDSMNELVLSTRFGTDEEMNRYILGK